MGRPIYPHELADPDFAWLLSSYRERHPNVVLVESTLLPVFAFEGLDSSLLPLPSTNLLPAEIPTEDDVFEDSGEGEVK